MLTEGSIQILRRFHACCTDTHFPNIIGLIADELHVTAPGQCSEHLNHTGPDLLSRAVADADQLIVDGDRHTRIIEVARKCKTEEVFEFAAIAVYNI